MKAKVYTPHLLYRMHETLDTPPLRLIVQVQTRSVLLIRSRDGEKGQMMQSISIYLVIVIPPSEFCLVGRRQSRISFFIIILYIYRILREHPK